MKLLSLTPNIMVEDVNKTVDWYIDNLGFQLVQSVPDEIDNKKLQWAQIKLNNVELMFQSRQSLCKDIKEFQKFETKAPITFYIKIYNIKEFFNLIKENVEIIEELHITFYNTMEFLIKDINGYYLSFSEKI